MTHRLARLLVVGGMTLAGAVVVVPPAHAAAADPELTAHVGREANSAGWYRKPVTISFTCTEGSAPLTEPCPAPVRIDEDGADQSVTRTITAEDGGTATVVVDGIDLDTTGPTVRIRGQRPATIRCVAKDTLSGLSGECANSRTVTEGPRFTRIRYTAGVSDYAGNTSTTTRVLKIRNR